MIGQNLLTGEYLQQVTEHNRLVIPVDLRNPFQNNTFYVSTLFGQSLHLYPTENLTSLQKRILTLSPLHTDVQKFFRIWYASLHTTELDDQGRFVLNKVMLEQLKIGTSKTKQALTVIGVSDHLEIYQADYWTLVKNGLIRDFEVISERVAFLMERLDNERINAE